VVAYYNGVRMRGQESLEKVEEETGYAIFVEVNLRKDKNAEHMDVPPEVTTENNRKYEPYTHFETTTLMWRTVSGRLSDLTKGKCRNIIAEKSVPRTNRFDNNEINHVNFFLYFNFTVSKSSRTRF